MSGNADPFQVLVDEVGVIPRQIEPPQNAALAAMRCAPRLIRRSIQAFVQPFIKRRWLDPSAVQRAGRYLVEYLGQLILDAPIGLPSKAAPAGPHRSTARGQATIFTQLPESPAEIWPVGATKWQKPRRCRELFKTVKAEMIWRRP